MIDSFILFVILIQGKSVLSANGFRQGVIYPLHVAESDCGRKTAGGIPKGENLWLIGEFLA
jgi:hypothetical protein